MPNPSGLKHVAAGAAAIALIVAGLIALPALAQTAAAPADGPRGAMARMHADHMAHMCTDLDAHQAAILAFAQVKLKITDAQKAAWTQFEDKAKASTAPIHAFCDANQGKPAPATLPDRLALMEAMGKARLAHLSALTAAVGQLYPQLSPEQKQIADHALEHGPEGFGEPGMGFHGHMDGMMGPHGHPPLPAPDNP